MRFFLVSKLFLGTTFDVFEASWGAFYASWDPVVILLEPLEAILSCLGGKLGWLWVTFGALQFFIIFWSDFGCENGAQREAFWEPKWSQNRSQNN